MLQESDKLVLVFDFALRKANVWMSFEGSGRQSVSRTTFFLLKLSKFRNHLASTAHAFTEQTRGKISLVRNCSN